MNLNIRNNEYNLLAEQTDEVIRLYGIPVKIINTKKINKDITFGDWECIEVDEKNVFEVYTLPENSEEFEEYERLQTQFGISGDVTINLFISLLGIDKLTQIQHHECINPKETQNLKNLKFSEIVGSIIMLPSNKLLEVADIKFEVTGINNLFTFSNTKNVYKLICRSYIHNPANKISEEYYNHSDDFPEINYNNEFKELDEFFESLNEISEKQDNETEKYIIQSDNIFERF